MIMVIRGKVRETYPIDEIMPEGMVALPVLHCSGKYNICDYLVLDRESGALVGTLFDLPSYRRILDASLKSENHLVVAIKDMFFGYSGSYA